MESLVLSDNEKKKILWKFKTYETFIEEFKPIKVVEIDWQDIWLNFEKWFGALEKKQQKIIGANVKIVAEYCCINYLWKNGDKIAFPTWVKKHYGPSKSQDLLVLMRVVKFLLSQKEKYFFLKRKKKYNIKNYAASQYQWISRKQLVDIVVPKKRVGDSKFMQLVKYCFTLQKQKLIEENQTDNDEIDNDETESDSNFDADEIVGDPKIKKKCIIEPETKPKQISKPETKPKHISKPVIKQQISEPVVDETKTEIIKPVVDETKTEIIKPVVGEKYEQKELPIEYKKQWWISVDPSTIDFNDVFFSWMFKNDIDITNSIFCRNKMQLNVYWCYKISDDKFYNVNNPTIVWCKKKDKKDTLVNNQKDIGERKKQINSNKINAKKKRKITNKWTKNKKKNAAKINLFVESDEESNKENKKEIIKIDIDEEIESDYDIPIKKKKKIGDEKKKKKSQFMVQMVFIIMVQMVFHILVQIILIHILVQTIIIHIHITAIIHILVSTIIIHIHITV